MDIAKKLAAHHQQLELLPRDLTNLRLNIRPSWDIEGPFDPFFECAVYDSADVVVRVEELRAEQAFVQLLQPNVPSKVKEDALIKLVSTGRQIRTVRVHASDGALDVTWDGSYEALPITELTLLDGVVEARCQALRGDRTVIDDMIYVSNRLIVDVERKKLVCLAPISQWKWAANTVDYIKGMMTEGMYRGVSAYAPLWAKGEWSHLHRAGGVLPVDYPVFNVLSPLIYPVAHEELLKKLFVFKQNGVRIDYPSVLRRTIIEGTLDTAAQNITLVPRMVSDVVDKAIFYPFTGVILAMDKLDPWLRTKARRAIMIQALWDMLFAKHMDAAEKVANRALKELRASHAAGKRFSVDGPAFFFKAFFKTVFATGYNRVILHTTGTCKLATPYKEIFAPLICIATAYPDVMHGLVHERGVSCTMPMAKFYENFDAFVKLLSEKKIELHINGKRVETISLDVSFDVERPSGSDWFNISPNIMSEGMVLTAEQREVLFHEVDKLETADCIKVLDEKSRAIIRMLAKMFHSNSLAEVTAQENPIIQLPRLRILDLLELRQAGARMTLTKEDEQLIARLTNFSHIPKVALPRHLKGALREYQKDGYQWLAFLYSHYFGACLADDMGLGKTIQAIAFLAGIAEGIITRGGHVVEGMPHLIVMPPTLMFNWQAELKKFYPKFRVVEYVGQDVFDLAAYDVVLATYDRMRINIDALLKAQFNVVIFDEAQTIKNIQAARTAAARRLKSLCTVTLTGTPLENHIGEYYSVIDVALPGLLPEYKKFMNYVRKDQHGSFIKKTRPFVLRRTKAAILKDLPPKVESNVVLPMDSEQTKVYATTALEVKRAIEAAYERNTSARANIIALTALLRLRQICISPRMIDEEYDAVSPKLSHLMSALRELVDEGHAALVFSQFTTCLDLVEKLLVQENIPFFRIDGSTPVGRRKKIVEDFQGGNGPSVLLLSLKTGGVGLNLTRANYIFYVDVWWNPAVETQAADRAHRIGQKNTVFIQRLIMHQTVEEKVLTLQEKKAKLFKDVLEHAENKQQGSITRQDLDFLLSS